MQSLRTRSFGILACVVCLGAARAGGFDDAKPPAGQAAAPAKPAPGHSYHGETFDEGPRQRAYLLGNTGNVHLPITTKIPEAQKFFDQGLGQVHGFWYYEAERSFRQVHQLDPQCAMAFWGMAMANVNNEKRAKGFIAEAVKRRTSAGEREQMYIDSLDAFYNKAQPGKNKERNEAYVKALEKLLYKFPDDVEARSMLALQLWKNRDSGSAVSSYLAVDALLEQVFRANPAHPAHHYRIHLWDHEHAENALVSAANCGQAAPGIAHMWHMSGHIFSDVKRYADAAWQQEASGRVDHAYMIRDHILPDQIHNYAHNQEWLNRDLNHVGRVRDAVALAKNLIELPRHPKHNTQSSGSSNYGRQRLFETLSRYELWSEMIVLCQTRYLDATDDEGEQLTRLRNLGRAYFRSGDSTQGQAIYIQIADRLRKLQAEKDQAVTTAVDKAKAEKKDDKQVEAAKNEASKPFNGRLNNLERASDEMRGYLAAMLGDRLAAVTSLQKSNIDELSLASYMLAAGQTAEAEKKARDAVNSHKNEVRVLALFVQLLWKLEKRDDAAKSFAELREISGDIDLQSPVFARLEPIARELNLPADWRIKKPAPADVGVRPPLDSLGPFTWHPYQAGRWNLKSADGVEFSSEQLHGKPYVLIFFLGHGCLHCTQQLQAFAPKVKEFADAGLSIVAVSTDDPAALQKSVEAFKPSAVPFPLLSNSGLEVFRAWRCHDDFENQPLHGTFVVDAAGYVRFQDIGPDPFMDANFVLQEAKRQLAFPSPAGTPPAVGQVSNLSGP